MRAVIFIGTGKISYGKLSQALDYGALTMQIAGDFDDAMQRAPAFLFESAREARDFATWLDLHVDDVRAVAESTTGTGKLRNIQRFNVGRFVYTRFNYTTGDAAGQNMTGKATWAAAEWIKSENEDVTDYMLEAQLATDKKHSHMNTLHTRGKRVVAVHREDGLALFIATQRQVRRKRA